MGWQYGGYDWIIGNWALPFFFLPLFFRIWGRGEILLASCTPLGIGLLFFVVLFFYLGLWIGKPGEGGKEGNLYVCLDPHF